jgi:hypothetical protein
MFDCGNGGRMYAEDLDASVGWLPLYTAPPAAQKPWVGLAEADKHKPDMGGYVYLNDDWLDGYKTGMEYAEAILKEKNA